MSGDISKQVIELAKIELITELDKYEYLNFIFCMAYLNSKNNASFFNEEIAISNEPLKAINSEGINLFEPTGHDCPVWINNNRYCEHQHIEDFSSLHVFTVFDTPFYKSKYAENNSFLFLFKKSHAGKIDNIKKIYYSRNKKLNKLLTILVEYHHVTFGYIPVYYGIPYLFLNKKESLILHDETTRAHRKRKIMYDHNNASFKVRNLYAYNTTYYKSVSRYEILSWYESFFSEKIKPRQYQKFGIYTFQPEIKLYKQ